ncbi:hypothetical protein KEM54_000119, partial [Ascosphaera aggregata]
GETKVMRCRLLDNTLIRGFIQSNMPHSPAMLSKTGTLDRSFPAAHVVILCALLCLLKIGLTPKKRL